LKGLIHKFVEKGVGRLSDILSDGPNRPVSGNKTGLEGKYYGGP